MDTAVTTTAPTFAGRAPMENEDRVLTCVAELAASEEVFRFMLAALRTALKAADMSALALHPKAIQIAANSARGDVPRMAAQGLSDAQERAGAAAYKAHRDSLMARVIAGMEGLAPPGTDESGAPGDPSPARG